MDEWGAGRGRGQEGVWVLGTGGSCCVVGMERARVRVRVCVCVHVCVCVLCVCAHA
jgi:hypothetical protein